MSPRQQVRGLTKVKVADLTAVEAAAKTWTPAQIDCRSLTGHAWRAHTALRFQPKTGPTRIVVTQKCYDCENKRSRAMDGRTGRWLDPSWSTAYIDGYLMPKGSGRVDEDGKSLLRMMAVSYLTVRDAGGDNDA
jgi:hypothetical protein